MQTLKMDFQSQSTPPVVPVMQSDAQSRFIGITLYNGGAPYEAPEGASYTVQYRGPGANNMGWYDTITLSSKNVVTLELAEQALRVNGNVFVNLCVVTNTGYMLKTFPILCRVTAAAFPDTVAVQSFFYVTGITSEQWLAYVTACQDAQKRAEDAAAKFVTDPTLSLSGKAADAAKVGEAVNAEAERAKEAEEENAKGVSQLKEDLVKSVNKYSVSDALNDVNNIDYTDDAFHITQYSNAGGYVWFSTELEFFETPTNVSVEFDVKCTNKITQLKIINTLTSDTITIQNVTGIKHVKYDVVGMSRAIINIKIMVYGGTLPFDIHFTNLVVNKKIQNNPTFTILEGTGTKKSIDKEFVKFVDYNDFYEQNEFTPSEYTLGIYTHINKSYSSDSEFRCCVLKIPNELTRLGLYKVWIGGNIGIWLKKDNAIIDVITKTSMKEYYEEIDVTNYDSIVFSTKTTTKTKVIYLNYKQSKYVSKEELKSNVLDVVIPNENIGFTTQYNTIAVDNSYKYSNWLKVKGGEKIKIYHALMTNSAVVQMRGVFETSYYSLSEIGEDKTFEFVLPDNVTHIRYSVANRFVNTTKVEYVSDYAEFTNDFIPALYTNAMPSRHDKPIITFVDDDGRNEYLTVLKPVFDNHGVKGTIAMIVSNVGTNPNFLTLEQLNSLKNDGYDIVSHTYSHSESIFNPLQNTGVTEEQIYNDLVTARRWLDDNGFNSECLIFPWGSYGNKKGKFIHQAIKAGYQFSCDATGQSNNGSVINTYWLDRPFILDSRDLSYYKNLIDSCIKSNGWLILSTHCYNETEMPNTELLESILDYIQEKGVEIMTFKNASAIKKNICSIGWLEDKFNKLYIGRDGKIYN